MFQFRHEVAVGEMGWTLPDAKDGYDIDAYDTEDTIYFLDHDSTGRLIASSRLNPTTRPHLLSDVFPEFVTGNKVPSGPDIYEHSRYLVTKEGTSKEEFVRARARVLLAVHEFALANGIRQLTVLTYQKHYKLAAYLSRTRPLGEPIYYPSDDEYYIAITTDVTQEGLDKSYMFANLTGPIGQFTVPVAKHHHVPHEAWTGPLPGHSAIAPKASVASVF
jgi:acyl-homoserine lactone synthase